MTRVQDVEAGRIQQAVLEAENFIRVAKLAMEHVNEPYSKHRATLRRSSMELTNALVEVRRSKYD